MGKKHLPSKSKPKELIEIVADVAVYPAEAYEFVQAGLHFTVERVHQETPPDPDVPDSHHLTGRQLSLGLRQFAWDRWGLLARTVLTRWNITSTTDFGRIVYALIDAGILGKSDSDRVEDFRNVYDFKTLETHYLISGGGMGARPETGGSDSPSQVKKCPNP